MTVSSFYYHLHIPQKSKQNPMWLNSVISGLELYGTSLFHSVIPVNAIWESVTFRAAATQGLTLLLFVTSSQTE